MAVNIGLNAVVQELDESQQEQAYKADDSGHIPRKDSAYNAAQTQGQAQTTAAYTI